MNHRIYLWKWKRNLLHRELVYARAYFARSPSAYDVKVNISYSFSLAFNGSNGGCRCCGSGGCDAKLYPERAEPVRPDRGVHAGRLVLRGAAEQEAGVRGVSRHGDQRGEDAGDSGRRTDGDESERNQLLLVRDLCEIRLKQKITTGVTKHYRM